MSATTALRWRDGALVPADSCDVAEVALHAADSWLVSDGSALALDLHRDRFTRAIAQAPVDVLPSTDEINAFWEAAITAIPREGDWFPRVEYRVVGEAPELRILVRSAPTLHRSIRLATYRGHDPRTRPTVKGPDLPALLAVRGSAQDAGADDAVIVSADGYVVEAATSALCWWVGDLLVIPDDDLPRIDSVTLRALLALAAATGTEIVREHVTPAELDGREIWAVNALHGIRVVTEWVDGPQPAEYPGRAQLWRDRLATLRRPLPAPAPGKGAPRPGGLS